jgi:CxxC-x17-CxxC domain-containing protein
MYQAVCADCQKDCEIPFQPSGDRPVYCKECFARRRASRSLRAPDQQTPKAPPVPTVIHAAVDVKETPVKARPKPAAAARKPVAKKKPAAPKKKK